jgi:hypothetical protein
MYGLSVHLPLSSPCCCPVVERGDQQYRLPVGGVHMERFKSRHESPVPTDTRKNEVEKPPIHTTESGTQYVRAIDVIHSKVGWAEIQRLKEANLVRQPASTTGENSSSQSKDTVT